MTYSIVTAILVLALIAVVIALVVGTDDESIEETVEVIAPPAPIPYVGATPVVTSDAVGFIPEESQGRERPVVDVPEDADRDSRPVGI